jgi:hypothetical protein
MDTTALRDAYLLLLTAADSVQSVEVPAGEWNADQVLGHIALVDAATIAAAGAIASGVNTTYDNRRCLDDWTIAQVIARAGGTAGLRDRIRHQGEALCTLAEMLSKAELDTPVPTLLLASGRMGPAGAPKDNILVDQSVPLRALISGLADDHLPRHTQQLLALLPDQGLAPTDQPANVG